MYITESIEERKKEETALVQDHANDSTKKGNRTQVLRIFGIVKRNTGKDQVYFSPCSNERGRTARGGPEKEKMSTQHPSDNWRLRAQTTKARLLLEHIVIPQQRR